MKTYNNIITLNKNGRGIYDLDPIKGCNYGMELDTKGCYLGCYAAVFAKVYGFDFSIPVKRYFKNESHINSILKKIDNIDTLFIRMGCSGDPSIDWEHTIYICKIISELNKYIVIITKHWEIIPEHLLKDIQRMNICINTSISALDSDRHLKHRLNQFYRLKNFCKSVLRINSCDFNEDNKEGAKLAIIQCELFEHKENIDNILRFNLNNPYVKKGIVNIIHVEYLKSKVYASVYNKNTYMGNCNNCPDLCGVNNMGVLEKNQMELFDAS